MKRRHFPTLVACSALFSVVVAVPSAEAIPSPTYQGPTAYLSKADSPWPVDSFGYCLETFEDGNFDIPGATSNGGVVGPGGNIDSVDADDGAIDGSGTGGRSLFTGDGSGGITIEFDPARTNGLPTQVGIVWTDGAGTITFDAFDKDGASILGPNGPNTHADDSFYGTTAEDRFYGITSFAGVAKIKISNTSGGIEVDHLQLNNCVVCGDANQDIRITATDALLTLKTSVGTNTCKTCVCDTNNSTTITASDSLAILKKSVGLSPAMNCPACQLIFG